MSFRKRNVGLSGPGQPLHQSPATSPSDSAQEISPSLSTTSSSGAAPTSSPGLPGVRPSPLDGRPTTSTGTHSLDELLGGHGGLALGHSVLIEESGTTDFASTLLRCYAAEGVLQGHTVHVVGVGAHWGRELPGVVSSHIGGGEGVIKDGGGDAVESDRGKMKIAWRYEKLGDVVAGPSGARGGDSLIPSYVGLLYLNIKSCANAHAVSCSWRLTITASPAPNRHLPPSPGSQPDPRATPSVFCHFYDLTKRLSIPSSSPINFLSLLPVGHQTSPFTSIIQALTQQLSSSPLATVHRLVIPTILSPVFYPPHASNPLNILQFLHSLRALLRQYTNQFTVMITLPLTLYPRSTGLVRWMEILSDGVLELTPFPHSTETGPSITTSGAATTQEEKPQGMVKVHRLPVFHENGRGCGAGAGGGDDMAFTVTRRKFAIKPFSLPPVEGDTDAQSGEVGVGGTKADLEF